MTILMWDKPKKTKTKAEWENSGGFEDGPTGGYVPNMSQDDEQRWKAKLVGTKTGFPQVEIRKSAGSLMTIIVNLGYGYNYKQYTVVRERNARSPDAKDAKDEFYDLIGQTTEGVNVHISANGPMTMTFQDMEDMNAAIDEAKKTLQVHLGYDSYSSIILKLTPAADVDAIKEQVVAAGAIFCAYYPFRRYMWVSCPDDLDLPIFPGVNSIELRSALEARARSFMGTDRYYDKIEHFK